MRSLAIVAFALLLGVGIAHANEVVDATDATFADVISKEFVLMEFYAPWCGHCKKLEPEYTAAAEQIGDLAVLAKIDATAEEENAAKYGIQGFPTIKVFRDGELAGDYDGGRSAADIVKYVKANVGPAVKPIVSEAELTALKADNTVAFVFFGAPSGDLFDAFESAAKKQRTQFTFAIVADAALYDKEQQNTIVAYKHFDAKRAVFAGADDMSTALTEFIGAEGIPLFDEIGGHNYKLYLDRKLPMGWLFTKPDDEEAKAAIADIAADFKNKVSFVWIDATKFSGMASRLGLKGDKFPQFVIDREGNHFVFEEEEVKSAQLKAFVTRFINGDLKKTIKSEEAPEPHTVDGLTTVVANTFEELVENAETDVFVEFYAPWCGHCKNLAPIYQTIAKQFEGKPIRIAQIDASANDVDARKYGVQGYPTLSFIPKDTRVPVSYDGERTEEALVAFLEERLA